MYKIFTYVRFAWLAVKKFVLKSIGITILTKLIENGYD